MCYYYTDRSGYVNPISISSKFMITAERASSRNAGRLFVLERMRIDEEK